MKALLALLSLLWALGPAAAQQVTNPAPVAIVCAYNTSAPTVAAGNFGYIQCDSSGQPGFKSATYASAGPGQVALSVTTATTLTVPAGATTAEICVETANVRYRDDGTNATAANGIPVAAGTCFQYSGPLAAINFTAQSGSPTLTVMYYK